MQEALTDEQSHTYTHRRARRILTIVLSALVVCGLCAGYVIADSADIVPGVLTTAAQSQNSFAGAQRVQFTSDLDANADLNTSIDSAQAQQLIKDLLATKGIGTNTSAIIMQADGTVVASHQADIAREPASTMKTLTSLAAASVLDMGATIATQTLLVQNNDTNMVILKGNGDMLLGAGESDPDHVNGRAGLTTLAQSTAKALQQRGITTVTFAYDDSLFGDARYPATISANNPDNLYYTGVSSMAIDGGRQRSQALADPDSFSDYPTLSQHTAQDTAQKFATLLRAQGITITNATPKEQQAPERRTALAQVQSAPLSAIMAFMLQHSDNTLAEQFGRLLALQMDEENSPQGATQAVLQQLHTLGINTDDVVMQDCSGLSPGSQLPVSVLAQVQQRNMEIGLAPAAAEGLSVPGLVGTANYRLANTDAAGLMRVKTGSLDAVTSMTGNVSRTHGGAAIFAIIVNNPKDFNAAKSAINQFIAKLTTL